MVKKKTPKSILDDPKAIPGASLPLKLPGTIESLQRLADWHLSNC
jgi:hypothetical protein